MEPVVSPGTAPTGRPPVTFPASRPSALGAAKQLGSPQTRPGGKASGHGQGQAGAGRPPSAGICGWEADAHGETDLHAYLGKDASQSHANTHSAPLSASAHSRAAGSMSGDGNLAAAILLARQAAESRQAAETANSSNGGSNSNSSPLHPPYGSASGGSGAHGGSGQRHLRWSVGGKEGPGGAARAGTTGRSSNPGERKRGSAPGMPTGASLQLLREAGEEEGAGGRAGGGGRAGADPDEDLDVLQQELEGEGLVVVQYDPGSDGEGTPRGPMDGASGLGALGLGAGACRGGGAGGASKGLSLLDSDDEEGDGEGDEGYQDLMTADDSELFGTAGGGAGEGGGRRGRQGGSGSGSGSGSGRSSGGVRGAADQGHVQGASGAGEGLKRGLLEGQDGKFDAQMAVEDEGPAEYEFAFDASQVARASVDGPGELQLQQLQQDAGMGTGPTSPLYAQQTVQYQQYLQQQQQQRSLGRRISGQPPPQQHHYQHTHTLYHTSAQGGPVGHGPQGQAQAHGGAPQRNAGVQTLQLGDMLPRRPQQLYAPLMRPITTGRSRSPVRGSGYMVRPVASPPRFSGPTPTQGSQPHPHLHAQQHPGHRHDPQTPQQHHSPGASGFPPAPPAPALPPASSRSSSASSTHNPHAPGPGSATAHQDAPDAPSQPSPRRQANSVTHSSVGGGFHAAVWPPPAYGLLRFPSSSLQHHLSTMAGGGGHTYRSTPISSGGAGTGLEGTGPAAAAAAGHAANGGWGPAAAVAGSPQGGHSPSRGHGNTRAIGRVTSAFSASQHSSHHPHSHHQAAAAAHGSRPATSPPSRRQPAHSHPSAAPDPAAADMPLHPRRRVEGGLAANGHDTHPAGCLAPAPAHPTQAAPAALQARGPMVPSLPAYHHYTPRHCGFNHSRSVPGVGLGSGALGPAGGEAGGSGGGSTGPMYGGSAFSGSRAKATDDRLKAALLSKVLASAAAKEQRQQQHQQQHQDDDGVRTEPAEGLLSFPPHATHLNQKQHPAGVPLREGGAHHVLQPTSLAGLAFGAAAGAGAGTGPGAVQLGRTRSLGRRLGNVLGPGLPDMGLPLMSGAGARGT